MILMGHIVVFLPLTSKGFPLPVWKLTTLLSADLSQEVCIEVAVRIARHMIQSICLVSIAAWGHLKGCPRAVGFPGNLLFVPCRLTSLPELGRLHVTPISWAILPRLIYTYAEYIIKKYHCLYFLSLGLSQTEIKNKQLIKT